MLVDDFRTIEDSTPSEMQAITDRIAVRRALAELNVLQRAAIALHFFADTSIAEVSKILQGPAGSVTSDLTRARRPARTPRPGGG